MEQHPFLTESNHQILPPQNVPLKVKNTDGWKKENMDALESIARLQFTEKDHLLDNYKLANGELLKKDYEGGESMEFLDRLSEDLSLPSFMKNYDIIGQPISKMEGQMEAFPDVFTVVGKGDIFENEKIRVKTDMLQEWFMQVMNQSINAKLGYEEDPMFDTEEEEQQYLEQVKALTPPEIEKYMKSDYKHILVTWGQHEMKSQFERFKLKNLRNKDFKHWLRAAQRFRHLYTGPKGLKVESLNPRYTFSAKSPNIDNIQDGDYAGFIQILSIPAVIDRYGHLMTDDEINGLQRSYKERYSKNEGKYLDGSPITHLSPYGVPYATRVNSLDPDFDNRFPDMLSSIGSTPFMFNNEEELSKIDGVGGALYNNGEYLTVTTAYWRSQRKLGKLRWINPEFGEEEILVIDETFVKPDYIKNIRNKTYETEQELNTILWTTETEIWQGIKIGNYHNDKYSTSPLYLAVQPAEIQIGKLLIGGHYHNNLNTKPTSLVDKIKPWQWFFNVLMNQVYHHLTTEIVPFAVFSSDMIPTDKDHGGENAMAKWMGLAQALGYNMADTSPGSNQNLGGQYPKTVDLNRTAMIANRFQLAMQIKQLALEHIGFSPQSMGQVKSSETATGVTQAVNSSELQTSTIFSTFEEGEKELMQLQLEAAAFLQARGRQIDTLNSSEMSVEALRQAMDLGGLEGLRILVSNSQEELRNLQLARQLALENNTSQMMMSDRLQLSTGTNIAEIIAGLKESEKVMLQQQQQDLQMRQQELQQQGMNAEAAREQAERHLLMELANNIDVATLNALGRQRDGDQDSNGISDIIDYNNSVNASTQISNQQNIENSKLQLQREKQNNDRSIAERKILEEREARIAELKLEKLKLKRDTVRGDKSK